MQEGLRRIAGLLLGAIFVLPGTLAVAVSPAVATQHPAGCHGHRPVAPSPAPISFQCCVNGHHAAIPNAAFTIPQDAPRCGSNADVQLCIGRESDRNIVQFLFSSSSPPGSSPLRI